MITIAGLTGSIAMGKSTAAKQFESLGIPVFDSDACVHALFTEPVVIAQIAKLFPDTVEKGCVNRKTLGKVAYANTDNIKALENLLHPLVLKKLYETAAYHAKQGQNLIIADVPLLFEAGWNKFCDYVFVVHVDAKTQKQRALARPDMSEQRFKKIIAAQMPSVEKCKWADFVIETYTRDGALDRIKIALNSMPKDTKDTRAYEKLARTIKEQNT